MGGKFVLASKVAFTELDWGRVGRLSDPAITGAARLAVVEARFLPGRGHAFHHHPRQEEIITVLAGRVEQWIDRDKRILGAGDTAFIPPGTVHASFNLGDDEARILAIFGPCVGDGFETVDVFEEAPWNGLRG